MNKLKRVPRGERRAMARELHKKAGTPWREAWDACKGEVGVRDAQVAQKRSRDKFETLRALNRLSKGEPIPIEMVRGVDGKTEPAVING